MHALVNLIRFRDLLVRAANNVERRFGNSFIFLSIWTEIFWKYAYILALQVETHVKTLDITVSCRVIKDDGDRSTGCCCRQRYGQHVL